MGIIGYHWIPMVFRTLAGSWKCAGMTAKDVDDTSFRDHVVASCQPSNFDDHLSSCPRAFVPCCREWTRGKTKVESENCEKGRERERRMWTGEEEPTASREQKRGNEREMEIRGGKFGGDFQAWRVARVKAIHSITLWGHWETLVLAAYPYTCTWTCGVSTYLRSDGIMLEKPFNSVKADVARWITGS